MCNRHYWSLIHVFKGILKHCNCTVNVFTFYYIFAGNHSPTTRIVEGGPRRKICLWHPYQSLLQKHYHCCRLYFENTQQSLWEHALLANQKCLTVLIAVLYQLWCCEFHCYIRVNLATRLNMHFCPECFHIPGQPLVMIFPSLFVVGFWKNDNPW